MNVFLQTVFNSDNFKKSITDNYNRQLRCSIITLYGRSIQAVTDTL